MISPTDSIGGAAASAPYDPKRFDWPLAFPAEKFLATRIGEFLAVNASAQKLSDRMRDETGTDFFEWVDHLVLSPDDEAELRAVGFLTDEVEAAPGDLVLHHPRATLPRVILRPGRMQNPSVIALRPEFVADFVARHNLPGQIEGEPLSQFRRVLVNEENDTRVEAVERRAYRGFLTAPIKPGQLPAILKAKELWKTRRRFFADDSKAWNSSAATRPARFISRRNGLIGKTGTAPHAFRNYVRTSSDLAGAITIITPSAVRASISWISPIFCSRSVLKNASAITRALKPAGVRRSPSNPLSASRFSRTWT
jgi:hypothetical protein